MKTIGLLLLAYALFLLLRQIRRNRARLQAMEPHQLEEENYFCIKHGEWPNRYSRELRRREEINRGNGITPWTSAH
jgi:hypothetical protein